MRIGRTLPPAAAPIGWKSFFWGFCALFKGESELNRFNEELKEYFNKPYCFLVSSGKAALTLIFRALKERYPERNEVIIPAYTCYSVPSAVIRAGLKIKLCDTASDSFDFDFEQLAPMLKSKKLLCVVSAHLFGLPSDVRRLKGMIKDPAVSVIEDAAQAMGGEWQGGKLGTFGDVGFFSLGRGKAYSTVEGGVILTNSTVLADNLKRQVDNLSSYKPLEIIKLFLYAIALNILLNPIFFWIPKSLPFLKLGETIFDPNFKIKKMSSYQAGLTKEWVEKLHFFRQTRKKNIKKWLSVLEAKVCKLYSSGEDGIPDLIRLPLKIENQKLRSNILKSGSRAGTGVAIAYPDALNNVEELTVMFKGEAFPFAEKHARTLITAPIHPLVTGKDIAKAAKNFSSTRLNED